MSSGAIAMVGGAGGGTNVSTMTVGVTNAKDGYYYGFVALPFFVTSDEDTPQIGSLSPNHVTVGGVNYTVHVLRTSNTTPNFMFTVADPSEALSATSVTSVETTTGTVATSGLTFQKVTEGGVNYAQWTGTGADIFGTVEDASVSVIFNV